MYLSAKGAPTSGLICCNAWSFSAAVLETMQSAGARIFRSRIYASLAVKSTQILPAIPVRITRRMRSVSNSVSIVVS